MKVWPCSTAATFSKRATACREATQPATAPLCSQPAPPDVQQADPVRTTSCAWGAQVIRELVPALASVSVRMMMDSSASASFRDLRAAACATRMTSRGPNRVGCSAGSSMVGVRVAQIQWALHLPHKSAVNKGFHPCRPGQQRASLQIQDCAPSDQPRASAFQADHAAQQPESSTEAGLPTKAMQTQRVPGRWLGTLAQDRTSPMYPGGVRGKHTLSSMNIAFSAGLTVSWGRTAAFRAWALAKQKEGPRPVNIGCSSGTASRACKHSQQKHLSWHMRMHTDAKGLGTRSRTAHAGETQAQSAACRQQMGTAMCSVAPRC